MIAYIISGICFLFAAVLAICSKPTPGGVNMNTILLIPAGFFAVVGVVILAIHFV